MHIYEEIQLSAEWEQLRTVSLVAADSSLPSLPFPFWKQEAANKSIADPPAAAAAVDWIQHFQPFVFGRLSTLVSCWAQGEPIWSGLFFFFFIEKETLGFNNLISFFFFFFFTNLPCVIWLHGWWWCFGKKGAPANVKEIKNKREKGEALFLRSSAPFFFPQMLSCCCLVTVSWTTLGFKRVSVNHNLSFITRGKQQTAEAAASTKTNTNLGVRQRIQGCANVWEKV